MQKSHLHVINASVLIFWAYCVACQRIQVMKLRWQVHKLFHCAVTDIITVMYYRWAIVYILFVPDKHGIITVFNISTNCLHWFINVYLRSLVEFSFIAQTQRVKEIYWLFPNSCGCSRVSDNCDIPQESAHKGYTLITQTLFIYC